MMKSEFLRKLEVQLPQTSLSEAKCVDGHMMSIITHIILPTHIGEKVYKV